MNWTKVSDRAPPYDVPLLIRSRHPEYKHWLYCIAFNLCYPPHCNLRQNFDFVDFEGAMNIKKELEFEPEEWIKLEMAP
jgi:hypothetical protein